MLRLSDEQRRKWAVDGYLHLEGVLTPDEVEFFSSEMDRIRCLLYNYCQMCVRSYDFESVPDVKNRSTPRQRRLLGDLGYDFRPGSYFYVPEDQESVIGVND